MPRALAALLAALLLAFSLAGAPAGAAPTAPPSTVPVPAVVAQTAADDGKVPVIVELDVAFRPEPDLPAAAAAAQRRAVRAAGDAVVAAVGSNSVGNVKRYDSVPLVAMVVDEHGLDALTHSPHVAAILPDELRELTLQQSTAHIGATTAWGQGVTGNGQAVAIVDTGVDNTHPFLSGKVVAEACYSSSVNGKSTAVCPNGTNPPGTGSEIGLNAALPCPVDPDCDHGTHVAGIAAGGTGSGLSGVAHGADIIAVQVFSDFQASQCQGGGNCALAWTSDIVKGLDYVYGQRNNFDIAAVNMSLGGGHYTSYCNGDATSSVIANLKAAGIATVISSGNDNDKAGIGSPSCVQNAISVGATQDSADVVGAFSNSHAILDVLAPGISITSSVPGGGNAIYTGTSMAAPHVTGAIALLDDFDPTLTVDEIDTILKTTGVPVNDTNGVIKPRIDLAAALESLEPPVTPPTVTSVAPGQGPITGGTSVTITGTGFTGTTSVVFGTTPAASFVVNSDAQITAVTAPRAAGLINVYVTNPAGTNPAVLYATWFNYKPPGPNITLVSPSKGPSTGGASVVLTGTGFTGATAVKFGTTPAASFIVNSDTQITAVTGPRSPGLVNAYVTTPGGTSPAVVYATWYTYELSVPAVTQVSPSAGPSAGGTVVTITGTGFTAATAVTFGTTPAASFVVNSDSSITATTAARAPSLVNVYVTTPKGKSAAVLYKTWFSYQ